MTQARSTALALEYVLKFVKVNKDVLPSVKLAWEMSSDHLVDVLGKIKREIIQPLEGTSHSVRSLVLNTNCKFAHKAYLDGSRAMCQDFIESTLVLTGCFALLSSLSVVLTVLYCMVWSIYQR